MKKLKVFLIAVLVATGLSAQNLVTNGNFSVKATNTGCPSATGFNTGRPNGWWDEETKPQGFLPYAETPDYFHPCAPNGTYNPGANRSGCADPKAGTAYTGLLAWTKNHPDRSAEYMYQELASPLIKNQPYYIEFWVSAADDPQFNYFVASLGMYLTNNVLDFAGSQNRGYHNLAPSVKIPNTFPAANYYTTTSGWQKISGTYTPTVDGVKHILIGNFDPGIAAYDPQTNPNSPNIQHRPGTSTGPGQTSYYFIDAVHIAPVGQSIPDYTLEINGASLICDSEIYTINNLPLGATVSWSVPPSVGPVMQLSQNTPSINQLTITNQKWYSVTTTLTAEISASCGTIYLTKTIANDNNSSNIQYGSYYQEACYVNNVYYPSKSGTLNGSTIFLNKGCMTSVTLYSMAGRTVSFSGSIQPLYWSYNINNQTLLLQLPSGAGGVPFTFNITRDGACFQKSILFFTTSIFPRYTFSVSPNPVNNVLNIDAKPSKEQEKLAKVLNYSIDIVDATSGESVLKKAIKKSQKKDQVNITKLKKGYYVLRIIEGDEKQEIRFLKE